MSQPLVELVNVSFRYESQWALSQISFEIGRGEYVGLIGPNGGGKTTALKLILGLLKPSEGEVRVFGKPASRLSRIDRSQIGFVRQRAWDMDPSFPGTVHEVAQTALYARAGFGCWLSHEDHSHVDEALHQVGLWERRRVLVRELSIGQQQRLYLARALACGPKLLLLDEPTSAVDTQTQRQFYELIGKLQKEQSITVVLVSHDLDSVAEQVETLTIINRELVFRGPVAEGAHHMALRSSSGDRN